MDIQPVRDVTPASPAQPPAAAAARGAAPVPAAGALRQPESPPDSDELVRAVEHLNKAIESMAPGIEFSIDEEAHATVVKVVDLKTNEVLRQMPTAEMLEIAKSLHKLQGLLIRQQA
jgi:flagellar protein FlaG